MSVLSHGEVTVLFLSLGILLAISRLFGEIARRVNQPAVLGELLAGILLGPTILGYFFPDWVNTLFPTQGPNALALNTITTLAVALFLLVAGLEVDLLTIWRQGRAAIVIGICGITIPFVIGFFTARIMPQWLHAHSEVDPMLFSFFFATALSISALPVIAKTLMDLNLYRSDMGMIIIAAAIFNDLVGWIIFAVILSFMGGGHQAPFPVGYTVAIVILFTAFMLTGGKWLINRSLPWIQAHTTWPGGVMGFAVSIALLAAAFTEWIGIHAIFGSFLAGVAIGESIHLRERVRSTILQFVSFVFAPLFFAAIGLKMNFAAHFDPWLTFLVLVIACVGKVFGCSLGAYFCGVPTREAWSIGFGLNARGAMEIIIGTLALQNGLIGEEMFVALVVMALVTSMMSGPFIQWILRPKRPVRFMQFLNAKTFSHNLHAVDRRGAIEELGQGLSHATGIDKIGITEKVLNREEMMSTGIGHGVAVPHARLENLNTPYVGLGISTRGIDFDSPDGEPAHVICMILTPRKDNGAQVEILADIARTFKDDPTLLEKILEVNTYTEFLAILNIKHTEGKML